jgi:hypothetical protein
MGKAADNEQIKLKATFYNNISVGSALAGVFIPYFQVSFNPEARRVANAFLNAGASSTERADVYAALIGVFGAVSLALLFRALSHVATSKIMD